MRIGVPWESRGGETRVAATPATTRRLLDLGSTVFVEAGAGRLAGFVDAAYVEAGADIVGPEVWNADVILKVNAPADLEVDRLRAGQILVALLAPALEPALTGRLAARGVTALAMDAVPRISRAQSLDVLSSMANIGGYRAVIEAAHEFGSFFTGQVTAAGKVPPAEVLVVGAGVAGLAAIGTARSLGAVVRAFDARPEVAEQVESMGAEFLRIDVDDTGPSADGYARETSADFDAKAAELYATQAARVDIVVTTALIPGRPAPRLLTAEMVASMKPGAVVVDMAAANGGNVEGTVSGRRVVTANGVTILGYTDLPGRLPTQASQLFGTNLVNLMTLLTPGKNGEVVLDLDDVVQRGMTTVHDGQVLWPPPPVQVSAAPTASPTEPVPAESASRSEPVAATDGSFSPRPRRALGSNERMALVAAGVALFLLVAALAPEPFLGHLMVFVLSVVIGFYVIGNVHHALHTPLMSVTNAISGIIVVGALLQVGQGNAAVSLLAFLAILVASINVFGGFRVTARMLQMFRREEAAR
ncbi:MAG: Re/Si-specific NAD(P)(+) transhydrogenase subunit alpha [Phycicoccus sp.]